MGRAPFEDLWRAVETAPDRPALRCGDRSWTFADFRAEILRAEAGLRRRGVRAGDLVTILSLNTPETIAAFYAVDRIGAVANWVDMKLSPAEVEGYLVRARSKVVLVLELAFAKVYGARGQAPAEHYVVLPLGPYLDPAQTARLHCGTWRGEPDGPACLSWAELLAEPTGAAPETDRWEEPLAITYTGGTTGPAKGVALSRRAFRNSLIQYTTARTEYGPGGASLTLLPPFAAFGLCQCVHVPLCTGMTVILAPLFRPHDLGALLLRYRPEQVNGTTSYWQFLLDSPETAEADLSFLKVPRNGGDAMAPELERRIDAYLRARGCTAGLVKEYGLSEVCGIVCLNYGAARRTVGSVGLPMVGCTILAADPETGRALPPGEEGELIVRRSTVMNGYYGAPEADAEILRPGPDGALWVWTKDIGHVAADGRVYVTGRRKRMISRNGFKIFPSVLEDCLLGSPLVADCGVVAAVAPDGETRPVAFVVPAAGRTAEEVEPVLRARAKERLNEYVRPAAYLFRPSLPHTDRGKLDYRALERQARIPPHGTPGASAERR